MQGTADTQAPTAPSGDLEARVAALEAQLSEALSALEASRAREAELKASLDRVVEQLRLQATRYWARRTEAAQAPTQLLLPIFNECEALEGGDDPACAELEPGGAASKPAKRRRGGRPDLSGLPVAEVVEYELAEGDGACPECGAELRRIRTEVTRTVRVVPARLEVVERRRAVYACPECSRAADRGEGPAVLLRAPMPADPIPGSAASPSALAWVLDQKYTMGSPLYRLERMSERELGLRLSRETMSNWCVRAAELWLAPLAERMRAAICARGVVQMDETPVQCLREPSRASASSDCYVWVAGTAEGDPRPLAYYRYGPGRDAGVAASILGGSPPGWLVTDGYKAYLGLAGVRHVACGVHIRRKFAELVKAAGGDRKARAAGSLALQARERIDLIFHADASVPEGDPEARRLARLEDVGPLVESCGKWLAAHAGEAMPRSALAEAFSYALDYWPLFANFLEDGRLPLSNNLSLPAFPDNLHSAAAA